MNTTPTTLPTNEEIRAMLPPYQEAILRPRVLVNHLVATVTVSKAFIMRDSFESPCQYYSIQVEPGDYRVELRIGSRGDRWLAAIFTGPVLSSGWGTRKDGDKIGTPGEIIASPYKYQLRRGDFWGAVAVHDLAALETAQGV